MRLDSRELTILVVNFVIAIFLMVLVPKLNISSSVVSLILVIGVVIIIIALIFGIIYKRIGEIDKALETQETKQSELEEKLKRSEQLIDIKADIKNLQGGMEKIENGEKS